MKLLSGVNTTILDLYIHGLHIKKSVINTHINYHIHEQSHITYKGILQQCI